MNKLPKFSSNKKSWTILNSLMFGPGGPCPVCNRELQQRYAHKYLWLCRLPPQVPPNSLQEFVAVWHEA